MEKQKVLGEYFWEKSEFHSFGAIVKCSCSYDFDGWVEHEVRKLILFITL